MMKFEWRKERVNWPGEKGHVWRMYVGECQTVFSVMLDVEGWEAAEDGVRMCAPLGTKKQAKRACEQRWDEVATKPKVQPASERFKQPDKTTEIALLEQTPGMVDEHTMHLLQDAMQVVLDALPDEFKTLDDVLLRACAEYTKQVENSLLNDGAKGHLDGGQHSRHMVATARFELLANMAQKQNIRRMAERTARKAKSYPPHKKYGFHWFEEDSPYGKCWRLRDHIGLSPYAIRQVPHTDMYQLFDGGIPLMHWNTELECVDKAERMWLKQAEDTGLIWRESEVIGGYWRLYDGRHWQPVTVQKLDHNFYLVRCFDDHYGMRENADAARRQAERDWQEHQKDATS